jgi:hypothetical protein
VYPCSRITACSERPRSAASFETRSVAQRHYLPHTAVYGAVGSDEPWPPIGIREMAAGCGCCHSGDLEGAGRPRTDPRELRMMSGAVAHLPTTSRHEGMGVYVSLAVQRTARHMPCAEATQNVARYGAGRPHFRGMDVPRIIFIAVLLAGCTGGDRQAARTTTDTTVTPVMTTDTTVVQQKVNVQVDTVKKTHHKP